MTRPWDQLTEYSFSALAERGENELRRESYFVYTRISIPLGRVRVPLTRWRFKNEWIFRWFSEREPSAPERR